MKRIRLTKTMEHVDVNTVFKIDEKLYRVIGITYQSKGLLCRINPLRYWNKSTIDLSTDDYIIKDYQ